VLLVVPRLYQLLKYHFRLLKSSSLLQDEVRVLQLHAAFLYLSHLWEVTFVLLHLELEVVALHPYVPSHQLIYHLHVVFFFYHSLSLYLWHKLFCLLHRFLHLCLLCEHLSVRFVFSLSIYLHLL